FSANIKERADCSAALFTASGELLVQAEHIPVHLGSMPASVLAAIDAVAGAPDPGDEILLNDPFAGGTHVNDLTLVSPCFAGGTWDGSRTARIMPTSAGSGPGRCRPTRSPLTRKACACRRRFSPTRPSRK